jgi:hypothetical protein
MQQIERNEKGGVTVRVLVTLDLAMGAEVAAEDLRQMVETAVKNDGRLVAWTDNDVYVVLVEYLGSDATFRVICGTPRPKGVN